MSDKPDAVVNANDVPFGHGLELQDVLEIGAFLEMLSTAPMSEISEPAARFQTTLVQAAKKCMAAFVAKNYPDAHAAILMPDDKTDAAKNSLDEIIKNGSK